MEPKKDNIIQKITTERGFADEIYRKYRYDRYGIGSCCGSNLPSSIQEKYLCDYQDNKISQYDKIEIVKTTYTPPEGGAQDDPNRPSWVDEYCGNSQGDVDIYFYYDATSLGLAAVQNAYSAASEWVNIVRSGNIDAVEGSCVGGEATGVNEYHTTIFGERWLDWATSAMTGVLQNSGSCGGHGTVDLVTGNCNQGNPVNVDVNPLRNFGLNACQSASDSTFPQTVQPNNKFWEILSWAQTNGIAMHNGGIAGATVANSAATDNSGGIFNSVTTIGMPPASTNKNLLVVCFIDEATSQSLQQPYHDNGPNVDWNSATDGTGTVTPCWGADHEEFIVQRNLWMSAQTGRQSDFYLYPSKKQDGIGNSQIAFPLHALGAISSGDQTPQDGTFSVAPFCSIASMAPILTSNPYFAQGKGALDQHGWGVEVATEPFTASDFQGDLDEFTDLSTCNDSECFLFVVKNQNGDPIEDHPIVIRGGIVGYTDENGLFRWCVENASDPANRHHVLDLCTCLTTQGGCRSQKVSMTVTDSCLTSCPETPFQACATPKDPQSSGNEAKGCTDPAADNYDPTAVTDDGSCTYCAQFNITEVSRTNATDVAGVCQNDGAIDVTVNGGVAPYTYSWTGPSGFTATTEDISNLCGGMYTLTVIDSSTNPCIESMVFYLDQDTQIQYGCTDATACNYDSNATDDDGSCLYSGCTSDSATNYDPTATADCNCEPPTSAAYQNAVGWDSCCTECVYGCTDPNANNFDSAATCDDGSCAYNWSCVETQVPGGALQTNNCQNLQYVGTFNNTDYATSQLDFLEYISDPANNLHTTSIQLLQFSSTYLSPFVGSGNVVQCYDPNVPGASLHFIAHLRFGFYWSQQDEAPIGECNVAECGCVSQAPQLPNCWPSSWTQFLPNGGYQSLHTHYGSWQEFLDLLDTTITDGQTWSKSDGTNVTSFSGLKYSEVADIISYSQGSCATPNPNQGLNLIFPNCCCIHENNFLNVMTPLRCSCVPTTTTDCNCTEMLDGTGVYPSEADCLSSTTCCGTSAGETNYVCIPGTYQDDCSGLNEANQGSFIPWSSGVNVTIANEYTSFYSSLTDPNLLYWNINGGGGTCIDANGNNKYVLKNIRFFKNGNLEMEMPGQTNGVQNSWATMIAFMGQNYGYDGVTYPSLSGMDYQQVLVQLATSEPGVWNLTAAIRACSCTSDPSCDCIADPAGTYTDYQSCVNDCCPVYTLGCTDPTAVNYVDTAVIDDGSCIDCISTPFLFWGEPNNNTITVTPPTSTGNNDGIITVTLNTGYSFSWDSVNLIGSQIYIYDTNTGALIESWQTPDNTFPTQWSSTVGLASGNFTVVMQQVIIVDGIQYVQCSSVQYTQVGEGTGSQLWDCQTGSIYDESLITPGVLLATNQINNTATYFNIATINAGNTNGTGYYATYQLALDDYVTSSYNVIPLSTEYPWWYQTSSTAGVPSGYDQCKNDLTNAYKTSLIRIDFRDTRSGGSNLYSFTGNNTWADLVSFVNGVINGTHPSNVSFTTLRNAIVAFSTNYDLIVELAPVLCSFTGCGCVQSPTGSYTTQALCEQTCCTIGCTDPGADNYDPNASFDDGSCVYCSAFTSVMSVYNPTIPNGATNWTANNINVNNGMIFAVGLNGSGVYSFDVFFEGYNNNAQADPNALWPGYYKVVVTDDVTGCEHITYQQLDPLYNKCHDQGTPWIPTSLAQFTQVSGLNNFLAISPNLVSANYNVYATSATAFEVSNLLNTNGYTITIFDNTGTQLVTCSNCDTLAVTNAQATESYYIQIRQASDCAQIGVIFVMPTI